MESAGAGAGAGGERDNLALLWGLRRGGIQGVQSKAVAMFISITLSVADNSHTALSVLWSVCRR